MIEIAQCRIQGVGKSGSIRGSLAPHHAARTTGGGRRASTAVASARPGTASAVRIFFESEHLKRRARSVVGRQGTRDARRVHIGRRCCATLLRPAPDHRRDVVRGDGARPEDDRRVAREVEDRRFDSDVAGAAIENHAHLPAQFLAHMLGGGRADAPEAICRRRGDARTERPQQGERHWMTRNTQANGILSAGHDIRHFVAALEDQGQRPRPECARARASASLGMLRAHTLSCSASGRCTINGWSAGRPLWQRRSWLPLVD